MFSFSFEHLTLGFLEFELELLNRGLDFVVILGDLFVFNFGHVVFIL